MVNPENRAIVAIVSRIDTTEYPYKYLGIADLTECGTCMVHVLLPLGVEPFDRVPCFIYANAQTALAVNVRNGLPKLEINEYEGV